MLPLSNNHSLKVRCSWAVEDVVQLPVQHCTETPRTRYCHWTIAAAAVESLRNVRGVAPWPRPSPVSLCPPDYTLPPGLAPTTIPIPNSKSQTHENQGLGCMLLHLQKDPIINVQIVTHVKNTMSRILNGLINSKYGPKELTRVKQHCSRFLDV